MPEKTHKQGQDMPRAARVIAVAVGLPLLVGSAVVFIAVRPLNWEAVMIGIAAAGLGADLLNGGLRGKWPASALFWLEFPMGR